MPLGLDFALTLEHRDEDRVLVSVLLQPGELSQSIDGVSLQLMSRCNERIGPRMLLPIAGELHHTLISTVELRARGRLPIGARVLGTVWRGGESLEASVPADPYTHLETHARGLEPLTMPKETLRFEALSKSEKCALAARHPWIDHCELTHPPEKLILEGQEEEEEEESWADLDLDPESEAWLRDLMEE